LTISAAGRNNFFNDTLLSLIEPDAQVLKLRFFFELSNVRLINRTKMGIFHPEWGETA
jgi:hypothetical protein